jgi:Bacterial PH domain
MEIFTIAPTTGRAMWFMFLIPGVVLTVVVGLLSATVIGARTARFEVSPEGLRLRGDLYGRLIPADQIRGLAARHVNFAVNPELTPQRRTMGTGLPGYRAGWFRLRSGEKALVYLTDTSRAVYVPTTAGYSVLISPSEPEKLLAALAAVTNGE